MLHIQRHEKYRASITLYLTLQIIINMFLCDSQCSQCLCGEFFSFAPFLKSTFTANEQKPLFIAC